VAESWARAAGRAPDGADSVVCVRRQLALELACLPGKHFAVTQDLRADLSISATGILRTAALFLQPCRSIVIDLARLQEDA